MEAVQTLATGDIKYTYDGDGNMVKSVINGVTTYYPNQYYEKQVGGGADKTIKYYYAGSSRIAMRENGTLTWIITDHLGSTTALANEDGSLKTLMRYTASRILRPRAGCASGVARYAQPTAATRRLTTAIRVNARKGR